MLKIGDVAKRTGVSIRRLRHYDEIGLLKPSSHSAAGYRLYIKADLLKLQQIVSLQQMKFSLKQIQALLGSDELSLKQTLNLQLDYLAHQLAKQQRLYQKVKIVVDLLETRTECSLDVICQTMEAIKVYEKYYTPEQIESLRQRSFNIDESEHQQFEQAWADIFTGLGDLQAAGVAATDKRTKPFAVKARELVNLFTGGDQGVEKSLNNMYEQEGCGQMLRNHGLPVSDELAAYYEQALKHHAPS